jgi:hypothetical protein
LGIQTHNDELLEELKPLVFFLVSIFLQIEIDREVVGIFIGIIVGNVDSE